MKLMVTIGSRFAHGINRLFRLLIAAFAITPSVNARPQLNHEALETWTPNAQNQYASRSHAPWLKVSGEADADATVTVNDHLASRKGMAFWKELSAPNDAGPYTAGVTTRAAKPGAGPGGTDLIATEQRTTFAAGAVESFVHDADGNLTEDARWTYTWDAESRLTSMTEKALPPPPAPYVAPPRQKLSFGYDALSRRIRNSLR